MLKISILHSQDGDNEKTFPDVSPEDRAELGIYINKLIQKGNIITIQFDNGTSALIKGYDPQTNCWIVKDGKDLEKVDAADTDITITPKTAGG